MSRYIDADDFIKQQRELYCKNCARRMGVKNGKLKEIYKIGEVACKSCELNDALDDLDDYPEADVAPVRHANWIPVEPGSDVLFRCSQCETEVSTSWDYDDPEMFKYCPVCGAKMDAYLSGEGEGK